MAARLWRLLVLLLAVATRAIAAEPITIVEKNFNEVLWLEPRDEIRLTLSRLPTPEEGRLAIRVGTLDVTSQVEAFERRLAIRPLVPLPNGERDLVVFVVDAKGTWTEAARAPIRVLTRHGYRKLDADPQFDVTLSPRFWGKRNRDAGPSERGDQDFDASFRGGLVSAIDRDGMLGSSKFQILGSSLRGEALRFQQMGDEAPKTDLGEYLLGFDWGGRRIGLGHFVYGNHRHLLDQTPHRGLQARIPITSFLDLSLAGMSGRSIVGWENPFGLANPSDDNMTSSTVGVDLVKSPLSSLLAGRVGTLRVETTFVRGAVRPQASFNAGEVVDAERGLGFGLRLIGADASGRLRTDLSFARSRFELDDDAELTGGLDVVEARETIDNARFAEIALDVLRAAEWIPGRPLTLTLAGREERVDPTYKAIGVLTSSDQQRRQLELRGTLGDVTLLAQHTWLHDNLDDIGSIVETVSRETSVDAGIPFRTWLEEPGKPEWWWPTLQIGFSRVRQFAGNRSSLLQTDIPLDRIPDQRNLVHRFGADWSGTLWSWTLSYRFQHADEDIRETGREKFDSLDFSNEVALSIRPIDVLGLSFGVRRTSAERGETGLVGFTNGFDGGFDWKFRPLWTLTGTYSYTDEDDSRVLHIQRSYTLETQLARDFRIEGPRGWGLPGRIFVRHTHQSAIVRNRELGVFTHARNSGVDGGVSFSFF